MSLEFAEPTEFQLIDEVLDLDTGQPIKAVAFIARELRAVMQDRAMIVSRLNKDLENPWLVCPYCMAAVYLVSSVDRKFFFRHRHEDENCPKKSGPGLSQEVINALKYNGAKESLAHQRTKELVRQSLLADSRFSTPQVEKVWRGMDRKKWRKPDVQTAWNDRRFAFEIQLSTTYLSIVVERRDFYQAEGGHLVWIFQDFDPQRTPRAEEDVFFNNNTNVFVANASTLQRSRETGKFTLECWYTIPVLVAGPILDEWHRADVSIDELTLDLERQRVFFFDYDAERARLNDELAEQGLEALRQTFECFWERYGGMSSTESIRTKWGELRDKFKPYGLALPEHYTEPPFNGIVSLMLSAKHGRPIGYGHQRLIQVANTAFDHYKPFLLPFGWALQTYGHNAVLDEQDTKGTWKKRRKMIREQIKAKDPSYERNTNYDALIAFLLPQIKRKLLRTENDKDQE
ncbi:DUF6035 family protein [Noviherbaspirillum sp. ST9]|uniref:DUF6035 family protein n=1 Tax=Noviherbaspirillum sp. ST9 TaxID=3401606 RepID=UPI003B58734E